MKNRIMLNIRNIPSIVVLMLMFIAHSVYSMERDSTELKKSWEEYAKIGDLDGLARLLAGKTEAERLALVNLEFDGCTALHWAGYLGDVEMARFLTDSGAIVDGLGNKCGAPLHWAAGSAKGEKVVEHFLKLGANVNQQVDKCASPLHYAAANHCTETVQLLIGSGADVNRQDGFGKTPLYAAFEREMELSYMEEEGVSYMDVIRLLINAGADVDAAIKKSSELDYGDEAREFLENAKKK